MDSVVYKQQLKKNGVRVLSATEPNIEGPEGVLIESVFEGFAAYFSLELAQKTRRGMRETALKAQCIKAHGKTPRRYWF